MSALVCLAFGANASSASAASPAWQPVAVTGPTVLPLTQSETQQVYVDAEGGTYVLSFFGQETAPIAFDAPPSTLEAELNALFFIGGLGGNVTVTGGPGGPGAKNPYSVTFGGFWANEDAFAMSADSSGLSGGLADASVSTLVPGGQGTGTLALHLQNIGGAASSGTITYKAKLPPGVTITEAPISAGASFFDGFWECSGSAGASEFTCTNEFPVEPSATNATIFATITAVDASSAGTIEVEASGGGAPAASFQLPLSVGQTPAGPGIQSFVAGAYDENGQPDTQAGSHPYTASTAIFANTKRSPMGVVLPVGEFRDIVVDIPPGFLGNPIAVPECPESTDTPQCPRDTVVGVVDVVLNKVSQPPSQTQVFNTQAPYAYPAKYRYIIASLLRLNVVGSLRSDSDYGLTAASINTPQVNPLFGAFFTFWGAPLDASHEGIRCADPNIGLPEPCLPTSAPNTALLTNASNCSEQAINPPVVFLRTDLWQNPGETFLNSVDIDPVTGCDKLKFNADFTFQPSDGKADSPASFKTSVKVPSEGLTEPTKLANPPIKKAVVQLPEGVSLNPSGADGLGACSEEQIGLKGTNFPMPNPIRFNKDPNRCPDSSKIGTGVLKTALLQDPLKGDLYLAAQGEGNPYGSLFAIYLVIEDPRHGIFIKLPGKVEPDKQSGQVTVTLDNLPQVPFTTLDLTLKGGDRSALASPPICGKYTSSMIGTPWSAPESGPPTVSSNSFDASEGPNGMPCATSLAARPFDIGFSAGSQNPIAGAKSPFSVRITRPDGNQEIERLELSPPPGFVASLKGIPYCSDAQIASLSDKSGKAEQASPACPAASVIGTTSSGAGAGPTPYYAPGKLYLSGPYKGQTLSVVSVTPAVAGPFDLGNVVIRAALKLDPRTARITAISDPIPQMIEGVPLRARDIRIELDRPGWARTPTNCEAMSVDATLYGSNGAIARPSNRYQVGGCENLGFKPKLSIRLKGGTKRGDHPALLATLSTRDGDANIARAAVTLPPSSFLDQAHIRTVCTRVQFAANACPKGSIYGHGKAVTELLDDPIEGNVYLRSSDNTLPDLVAALKGVANIEAVGRIDSVKGGIRNTFDIVPDAPFDSFTLRMQGGKKGLVVNSQDLCAKTHRATVKLVGQNGRRYNFRPKVIAEGCKKAKKSKRQSKKRGVK